MLQSEFKTGISTVPWMLFLLEVSGGDALPTTVVCGLHYVTAGES